MLNKSFAFTVIGGVAAAGIGLTWFGVSEMIHGRASMGWKLVPATVISFYHERSTRGHGYNAVKYSYFWNSEMYEGEKVAFGFLTSQTDQMTDGFREGKEIQISVNPDNPRDSVIIPGCGDGVWGLLGLGGLFITACAGAGVASLRGLREGPVKDGVKIRKIKKIKQRK